MRSLRITLRADGSYVLPLAYNELVQGMLYSLWRDSYPELHGSPDEKTPFRPFVYGRLEGGARADGRSRTVRLSGLVHLTVRTPFEELLDECAIQLARRGQVRLGAHDLAVVNLESRDRLLFPTRALLRMETPVVANTTSEDGHTIPHSPADASWITLIRKNVHTKATSLNVEGAETFQCIPLTDTLRKQVTRFKGIYVTGWMGDLMVSCASEILAMLWCCGLGIKNSEGFGLFKIIDQAESWTTET